MILALLFSFAFHWFVDWVACRAPVMLISSCFRHSKATLSLSGYDFAWRTSVISAVHAIVTGLGSLIGFYMTPGLSDDLIESSSLFTINLVSYSVGYFLMDVIHMYLFSKTKGTVELIVHHVVIILCFSSSLYSGKYVGYSVVALLIEINSVFLHLRRISKYLCVPKENIFSRILCFANIGTFIVFRFMVMSWMTRWLVVNKDKIPLGFYSLGAIGLAILMLMNIVLFLRIVIADFRCNSCAAASLVTASSNSATMKSVPVYPLHAQSVDHIN